MHTGTALHIGQSATRQRGLTLVEILIVLVIVGFLATLAAPSFQGTIERNRRGVALEESLALLTTARAEAVSRASAVTLCASSDQATCNTNNWESGYIMFSDDGSGTGAAAGDRNRGGSEELLRVGGDAGAGITVRSVNFADAAAIIDVGAILFNNRGYAEQQATLLICDARGANEAVGVVLNVSGQPRLATDNNANGTVEDHTGTEVTCP